MDVSIETLEGLERKMLVVIPASRVEEKVNEKLEEAAKTARINGFRPGKVPKEKSKRRYGKSIREEVSSEIIQSSFSEAVDREDVNPAGMPKIEECQNAWRIKILSTRLFLKFFLRLNCRLLIPSESRSWRRRFKKRILMRWSRRFREQRMEYEAAEKSAEDKDKVNIDFEGS